MDLAALDIVLSAKIDQAISNIDKLNKTLDTTTVTSNKTAVALDATSRNLAKVASTTAAASGGMKQVSDSSLKAGDAISAIPKSFDEVKKGIDDIAAEFNNKWNAIIAEAEKLAQPLSEAVAQTSKLQQQVSSFGGGVLTFKAVGAEQVLQQSRLIVDSINAIPATKTVSFTISGSTQQALAGLSGLSAEIDHLATGGVVSLSRIIAAIAQLEAAKFGATGAADVQKYDNAINHLKVDLASITSTIAKSGTSFTGFAKSSNTANLALQNLGRVAQDLPFGFIGIANNLNPLLEGFQRLAAESKLAGVTIGSTLLKSLTGAGGLGLALSVVTSLLSFASFGLGAWTRGMGSSKSAVDDAVKSNEDYAKSLQDITDSAIKNAEKSLTELTLNTKAAQDNTLSLNERLAAANKLQEQSGYFAALSKEQILYGNITDAINKTTQAIFNKAYADAASGKATEAGTRVYELDKKRQKALEDLKKAQDDYNEAAGRGTLIRFAQGGRGLEGLASDLKVAKENIEDLTEQYSQARRDQNSFFNDATKYTKLADDVDKAAIVLARMNNQLDELNKRSVATGADFKTEKIATYKKAVDDLLALPDITTSDKRVRDIIAQIKALGGSFDEAASHASKGKATISSVLADLDAQIKSLSSIEVNLGTDESKQKISAILDTIKKLETEFKVDPKDTIIQKLFGDINSLRFNFKTIKEFVQKQFGEEVIKAPVQVQAIIDDKSFTDDFAKRMQALQNTLFFAKQNKIILPLGFELSAEIGGDVAKKANDIAAETQALVKKYHIKIPVKLTLEQANDFAKQTAALLDDITSQIRSTFSNSLITIGEGLGGGEDIFGKFASVLGEGVKSIGEDLIKLGTLALAAKLALASLFKNPLVEIAIGIALVALGTGIQSRAGIKLAEGGIIPPGFEGDRFPAFLNSNEAVIPLGKLDQFINNESQVIVLIPEHRISGNDIVVSYNRTTRKNKRTF